MAQWPAYTETRFVHIGVSRITPTLWRFVCLDWEGGGTSEWQPAAIGPHFRTKGEAMAALEGYAATSYPEVRT